MYCIKCGEKVIEGSKFCPNCGYNLSGEKEVKPRKKKDYNKIFGIMSLLFGVTSIVASVMLFFNDISEVGMYTKIFDRIIYFIDYSLIPILLTSLTIIFSSIGSKYKYSRYSTYLSIMSFFFILSELVVMVIY